DLVAPGLERLAVAAVAKRGDALVDRVTVREGYLDDRIRRGRRPQQIREHGQVHVPPGPLAQHLRDLHDAAPLPVAFRNPVPSSMALTCAKGQIAQAMWQEFGLPTQQWTYCPPPEPAVLSEAFLAEPA